MTTASNSPVIRPEWLAQIGKPSSLAVRIVLNVAERSGTDDITHHATGVVGVPYPHKGDSELQCLVDLLHKASNAPSEARFEVGSWSNVKESHGVTLERYEPSLTLNLDSDAVLQFKMINPAIVASDFDPALQPSMAVSRRWLTEYLKLPYLTFEDRKQLTERLEAVKDNALSLTPGGNLTLSNESIWQRMVGDVLFESERKGYPLVHQRHHYPGVLFNQRFGDGELCRKAAASLKGKILTPGFVVKYGKCEHMRDFYSHGVVRVGSASDFEKGRHNEAIRDQERRLTLRGVFATESGDRLLTDNDAQDIPRKFYPVRQAMQVQPQYGWTMRHENYATATMELLGDFRMYCWSAVLSPELFSDFEADACVLFDLSKFIERLVRVMRHHMPTTTPEFTHRVAYMDPLGAYGHRPAAAFPFHDTNVPVHLVKPFSYAYQKEGRLTWRPQPHEQGLEPVRCEIGSMRAYATAPIEL